MKLNYKKTFLLGLGFMSISLVWALFNAYVPIFLRLYISSNTLIGFLMTLDNYAGLFLQPTFGTLSDRTKTRFGKRMPYLLIGMPLAAVGVVLIPLHWSFASLIIIVVSLNIVMATFRSPTVALMPDITPEPLRSKANSIINLMGGVGAILAFLVGSMLYKLNKGYPFYMAAAVMLISVVVLNLNIREKRDSLNFNDAPPSRKKHPEEKGERLHGRQLASLFLLLTAIFLWFCAYNAVDTFFTLYGKEYLGVNEAVAASKLTFFSMAMVLFAIPAGIIATKIGRKVTMLIGLALICSLFVFLQMTHSITAIGYIFIGGGAAWAMININSYPLLLSMTTGGKVGRFTGYYYAFSCLAGIISPTLAGSFIDWLGYSVLFKYSVVGFVLSAILLLFVTEPKRREQIPQAGEEESPALSADG